MSMLEMPDVRRRMAARGDIVIIRDMVEQSKGDVLERLCDRLAAIAHGDPPAGAAALDLPDNVVRLPNSAAPTA